MEKKENIQFRILYFIAIILIVAGHAGNGGVSLLYNWFPPGTFHLALFVFASGYFFVNNKDKNILKFIIKTFKKFLIPLYVWNLIYGLIVILIHQFGFKIGVDISFKSLFISPITNGHQFVFNLSSWFIWPLFIIQILHIFIIKALKRNEKLYYLYFLFSLILGFIGVQLAIKGYNKSWFLLLVKILYFLPFFALGMLYKVKLEEKDILGNWIYFAIVFFITLVVIYLSNGGKTYTISWCNEFDNFYRPFIVGILGIAFWLRISRILAPICEYSKVIMLVSKNTFAIMMHHLMGFFLLNTAFFVSSKVFTTIEGFDEVKYKTNIFYRYLPCGLTQFNLLYLIIGILFSLLVAKISNIISTKIIKIIKIIFYNKKTA